MLPAHGSAASGYQVLVGILAKKSSVQMKKVLVGQFDTRRPWKLASGMHRRKWSAS